MRPVHRFLAVIACSAAGFSVGAFTTLRTAHPSRELDVGAVATARERSSPSENFVGQALACSGSNTTLSDLARLSEFLARFTSEEMGEYLDRLRAENEIDQSQVAWIFGRWHQRDREAANRWIARRLGEAAQDGEVYPPDLDMPLFAEWARREPEAALAAAERYPWSRMATELISAAFNQSQGRGRVEQLAFLARFPESRARSEALDTHFALWAMDDGSSALASAGALANSAERTRCMETVLQKMSEKNPAAAFESYIGFQINSPESLAEIVSHGAEKDLTQAIEWLKQLGPSDRVRGAPIVVSKWAGSDPGAALSWALGNDISLSQTGYYRSITHTDSMRITQYSLSSAYSDPLREAFEKQPAATLAWLQQLPPGRSRDAAYQLAVASAPDRAQALALFSQLPPAGAVEVAESLAKRFQSDLESGCAWAATLPAGSARSAAWKGIGYAAATPLDLPAGPDRDAMLYGRLFGGGEKIAEQSLQMTTEISDLTLRRDAFDEVMEMYSSGLLSSQADNARKWMENSADVPEEWKRPWRK